jgi:hypothetical protein
MKLLLAQLVMEIGHFDLGTGTGGGRRVAMIILAFA